MPEQSAPIEAGPTQARLGWPSLLGASLFYTACVALATYPVVLTLGSHLPDNFDALQHLWIMRWYKTALFEGRAVWFCPEIQFPIGAPLGNFSSLLLQGLLYIPLSLVIHDDVICYNILWMFGIVLTGLGTFVLIWHILRDRMCAAFGGILAMLSTPMMIHAHAHLELIYVGTFPLFLVAWMRLVDHPTRGRLVAAVVGYWLVAMSAAYYLVFAIFPAALYFVWRGYKAVRLGSWGWLRSRCAWLCGFAAAALPGLIILFIPQFWGITHGFPLMRSGEEFENNGAPLWSYVVPTANHYLNAVMPFNPFQAANFGGFVAERFTYLGVVTLLLLAYAAFRGVRMRRGGYFWAAFVLLVVLSMGSACWIGKFHLNLPSKWLWKVLPFYRMTRVPARFSLFGAVLAAVIAAAALKDWMAHIASRWRRAALYAGMTAAAVFDLAMVPFWSSPVPPMPGCYDFIRAQNPQATLFEAPSMGSGGYALNAACTYWQSLHRLHTSSGYSGHTNARFDQQLGFNSPFFATYLERPGYLADPEGGYKLDIVANARFLDYLWLWLDYNKFDYVVLHRWPGALADMHVRLDRVQAILAHAKVYEDAATVVYDRKLLQPPQRPTILGLDDARARRHLWSQFCCAVPQTSRVTVYNPDPDEPLRFTIDAGTLRSPRTFTLSLGDRELGRWRVEGEAYQRFESPPFLLPAGVQTLTLKCDGEDVPLRQRDRAHPTDDRPYSLRVAEVSLMTDEIAAKPRSEGQSPSAVK